MGVESEGPGGVEGVDGEEEEEEGGGLGGGDGAGGWLGPTTARKSDLALFHVTACSQNPGATFP